MGYELGVMDSTSSANNDKQQKKRSDCHSHSFQSKLWYEKNYAFSMYETIHAPTSLVPYFAPPST